MTAAKVAITIPADVLAAAKKEVEAGHAASLSALMSEAVDEKVRLDMGYAFDLAAERKQVSERRVSDREREYAIEIKLRNRKKHDVTIAVEENVPGDVDVIQKTHAFTRKDANTLRFDIPGDSCVFSAPDAVVQPPGDPALGAVRADLVFRILPGPGNYKIAGAARGPHPGTHLRRRGPPRAHAR